MSTAQSAVIEDAVIDILAHTGPCTMDQLVASLSAYEWSEVFSAVDGMSRDGRVVLRRPSNSGYQLSLSATHHQSKRGKYSAAGPTPVQFCVGCGCLCDELEPEDRVSPWVEASHYLKKYGLTWMKLVRIETMCPACSRVQACGTRRVSSRTVVPAVR